MWRYKLHPVFLDVASLDNFRKDGPLANVFQIFSTWNYQYRISDKVSSINLGHWPEVTRAEAIKRYQRARAKVSEGIDLQAERRAEKAQRRQREKVNMTLAALWQNFRAAKQRDWAAGTVPRP